MGGEVGRCYQWLWKWVAKGRGGVLEAGYCGCVEIEGLTTDDWGPIVVGPDWSWHEGKDRKYSLTSTASSFLSRPCVKRDRSRAEAARGANVSRAPSMPCKFRQ